MGECLPLHRFTSDPETIAKHLKAPLSKGEIFGLGVSTCMIFIFIYWNSQGLIIEDYKNYLNSGKDIYNLFFYPYWWVPIFSLFSKFPFFAGYTIWTLMNILGLWIACRVFGGNSLVILTSFQMVYLIGYGQIIGIVTFGLAVFWWGIVNKRWYLAGFGLILASTKFQSSFLFGLVLWLFSEGSIKNKLKTLLLPILATIASLLLYPGWPLDVFQRSQSGVVNNLGSMTLWRYIGPYALLLFLPFLIMPMNRTYRIFGLFAAIPLAIPYFQQVDLLTLFALPVGWFIPFLGNFGYMSAFLDWKALQLLWVLPLVIYLLILRQALSNKVLVRVPFFEDNK